MAGMDEVGREEELQKRPEAKPRFCWQPRRVRSAVSDQQSARRRKELPRTKGGGSEGKLIEPVYELCLTLLLSCHIM